MVSGDLFCTTQTSSYACFHKQIAFSLPPRSLLSLLVSLPALSASSSTFKEGRFGTLSAGSGSKKQDAGKRAPLQQPELSVLFCVSEPPTRGRSFLTKLTVFLPFT